MKATLKDYILLHISILIFSFTSVFTKLASIEFNKNGIRGIGLYLFLFLMFLNCAIYAVAWQKTIRKFELSIAYAQKTVYLIWSQLWAVLFFHEALSVKNIIGLVIVFVGVLVVQKYE
ncbi:MAG: EamA family transporter [Blautia sp.]|nr:EamA family transporter [Blautia sp.]